MITLTGATVYAQEPNSKGNFEWALSSRESGGLLLKEQEYDINNAELLGQELSDINTNSNVKVQRKIIIDSQLNFPGGIPSSMEMV